MMGDGILHRATTLLSLFLVLLPGGWLRGKSSELEGGKECCPGRGRFDPDKGAIRCLDGSEMEISPFPDCRSKVTLVPSTQASPDLWTVPHCHGEFLIGDEENATALDAFLLCPSDSEGEEKPRILVQKCCPFDKGFDVTFEECIPRPHNWSPSVFDPKTNEFRKLPRDEYELRIDDLSSIPCAKLFFFLEPGFSHSPGFPVVLDTGRLHVPALNSTYSNHEFCVENGRWQGTFWTNFARICHPTEKKIRECEGKLCVQKCCPESEFLLDLVGYLPQCRPAEKFWDPRKYFLPSSQSEQDIHVITGSPICTFLSSLVLKLLPESSRDPSHNFSLSRTGDLAIHLFHNHSAHLPDPFHLAVPEYCVDDTRNSNGTVEPIALVCVPRLRVRDLVPFAIAFFVSVAVAMQSLTFILLLLERKSLPGKIRLVYVGCMLLSFVSEGVRLDVFNFGVSNPLCLVATFVGGFVFQSAFFWLSVMGFDLWRNLSALQTPLREEERKRLCHYSLYGFGVPACLVAIACAMHFSTGSPPANILEAISHQIQMQTGICPVLEPPGKVAYTEMPVVFVLVGNAIFFGLTCRYLIQHAKDTARLKLFVVMGGMWLASVISRFTRTFEGLLFSSILIGLQGVLIFLIFVFKGLAKDAKKKIGEWLARIRGRDASRDLGGPQGLPQQVRMSPIRGKEK